MCLPIGWPIPLCPYRFTAVRRVIRLRDRLRCVWLWCLHCGGVQLEVRGASLQHDFVFRCAGYLWTLIGLRWRLVSSYSSSTRLMVRGAPLRLVCGVRGVVWDTMIQWCAVCAVLCVMVCFAAHLLDHGVRTRQSGLRLVCIFLGDNLCYVGPSAWCGDVFILDVIACQ